MGTEIDFLNFILIYIMMMMIILSFEKCQTTLEIQCFLMIYVV